MNTLMRVNAFLASDLATGAANIIDEFRERYL